MVYSKEAEVLLKLDGFTPIAASHPSLDAGCCRASFPKDDSHQGSNFILVGSKSSSWERRFIVVCEGHLNEYRSGWKKYEG